MKYGFGIAAASVNMAPRFQRRAMLGVIVYFAIEDNPYTAVFVAHRLMATGGQIDDRQPAKTQSQPPVTAYVHAFIVGSAMRHRTSHPGQHRVIQSRLKPRVRVYTGDATHHSAA